MLAVDSENISQPQMSNTEEHEQEPSFADVDSVNEKQQTKRKLFTPLNILIIIATLTLAGLGVYYLTTLSSSTDIKNQINQSHDKIITYADSSKKEGSNSGSSTSKASSNNDRPNGKTNPVSKTVISSNGKISGSGGSGDDEDDNNGDNNSDKNKNTGSGSSTEDDSEDESDEASEEEDHDPIVWVNTNQQGRNVAPQVGSTRDGGR